MPYDDSTKYGFHISANGNADFKPFVGMKVDFHHNKADHEAVIEKVTPESPGHYKLELSVPDHADPVKAEWPHAFV
jgi:hypothetical protein